MPRVIYCIHALSTHLFKLGKAPQIQDLYGKVNFTGFYLAYNIYITLILKQNNSYKCSFEEKY